MGGPGSGRTEIPVDVETLMDLGEMGMTQKDTAKELGISVPTLTKKIADIQVKQGILIQYRALQSLQLTELQARVLEAITPEKIADAPLRDLVVCFKILKDKELVLDGKPSDIKGLVAYLIELEKQDAALAKPVNAIDADFTEVGELAKEITDPDYVPDLGGQNAR